MPTKKDIATNLSPNQTIIQPFVPRMHSLSARIGAYADHWGSSGFFSEKIPFSKITSRDIAAKIINIIIFLDQQNDHKETLHLYEFGAGLGLLANNILDDLNRYYPNLYKKTIYHISDISKERITQLKTLPSLRTHKNKINFTVMDLCQPHFQTDQEPTLIFHTYLLDALSTRHIMVKDGQLYEVFVQTSVPTDLKLRHPSSFPPQPISPQDLLTTLFDKSTKKTVEQNLILQRQLHPFLREDYKLIPLDSHPDIEPNEKSNIIRFASSKKITNQFFNFSQDLVISTVNIIENLPEKACYLTIDYLSDWVGKDLSCLKKVSRQLRLNYGVYEYYGANFELLKAVSASTKVSQNPDIKTKLFQIDNAIKGHNLSLIISLTKPEQFAYLWDKVFTNLEQPNLLKNLTKDILKETTKEAICAPYLALSSLIQKDYVLLSAITAQLFKYDHYKDARHYALLGLESCSHLSPLLYKLLGDICIKENKLSEAETHYKSAEKVCPQFIPAQKSLAQLYAKTQHVTGFITTIKNIIYFTKNPDISFEITELIKAYSIIGDHKNKTALITWLEKQPLTTIPTKQSH